MDEQLILEVSQVNGYIKEMLESDALLTNVCIRGELSNYKMHYSGHHYFSLKDSTGVLKCVMFRSSASRLRFRPENGMTVLAAGRISVYPRDGVYQLYCVSMRQDGEGDLAAALERLKKKLAAEGLFDPAHKKPIPRYPHRIALVTSRTAAGYHDMLKIFRDRYPLTEVRLLPVRVQGENAAAEIAGAIDYVNRFDLADLIITGRGGGATEEMWAFNEEIVVRAIYNSRIPVISGVGHEIDVFLSDYAADVRAATPTNAVELAVPHQNDLREQLRHNEARMAQALSRRVKLARAQLQARQNARVLREPSVYLSDRRQQLDGLVERMAAAMERRNLAGRTSLQARMERLPAAWNLVRQAKRKGLELRCARLDALSPLKVLSRGYSITEDQRGVPVTDASQIQPGDQIRIRLVRGRLEATVDRVLEE